MTTHQIDLETIQPHDLLVDGAEKSDLNDTRIRDFIENGLSVGYWHTQSVASVTWTIPHGLNTRCVVFLCQNGVYKAFYPQEADIGLNTITLTFPVAVSGYCAVLFAKVLVSPGIGFSNLIAYPYQDGSGGTLSGGDPVYISAAGTVDLASWNAKATAQIVGIVYYIDISTSPYTIWVVDSGNYALFTGLTVGDVYYLEDGGYIKGPITSGKYRVRVFVASATDSAHIRLEEPEYVI